MRLTKTDLIIYYTNNIDILDLNCNQQYELAQQLIKNVNIKQLEDKIHEVILKLSGVGGPSFGSNITYIALDNQERLELIHQLVYYLDIFKSNTNYLKRQIRLHNYIEGEQIYGYLYQSQKLIDTIFQYGDYIKKDIQIQLNQSENKAKLEEIAIKFIEKS